MKIVAFLQCLWVKDPGRVRKSLEDMEKRGLREAMLSRLLFHGGHTGKVLRAAFGEKLCGQIIWEECTKEIAGKSSGVFLPDPGHIAAVLTKHKPSIILTFGKVATAGVRACALCTLSEVIKGPHPAMRMGSPLAEFSRMRSELELCML